MPVAARAHHADNACITGYECIGRLQAAVHCIPDSPLYLLPHIPECSHFRPRQQVQPPVDRPTQATRPLQNILTLAITEKTISKGRRSDDISGSAPLGEKRRRQDSSTESTNLVAASPKSGRQISPNQKPMHRTCANMCDACAMQVRASVIGHAVTSDLLEISYYSSNVCIIFIFMTILVIVVLESITLR